MDTSRLLGQIIIVLTGVIMAVAAAFFLLDQFVYPYKMADIEEPMLQVRTIVDTSITGKISKISVDEMVTSRKAVVTIETATGETKEISLPSNTRMECPLKPSIVVSELMIGATVIVSGDTTESGMIEPCKNARDSFTIERS